MLFGRARVQALPERGMLDAEELVGELSASSEHSLKTGTHGLEDEYALAQERISVEKGG